MKILHRSPIYGYSYSVLRSYDAQTCTTLKPTLKAVPRSNLNTQYSPTVHTRSARSTPHPDRGTHHTRRAPRRTYNTHGARCYAAASGREWIARCNASAACSKGESAPRSAARYACTLGSVELAARAREACRLLPTCAWRVARSRSSLPDCSPDGEGQARELDASSPISIRLLLLKLLLAETLLSFWSLLLPSRSPLLLVGELLPSRSVALTAALVAWVHTWRALARLAVGTRVPFASDRWSRPNTSRESGTLARPSAGASADDLSRRIAAPSHLCVWLIRR